MAKKSTQDALNKYANRYLKENGLAPQPEREITRQSLFKKRDKPEKLVEKECLAWMRGQNWNVKIYESKATYSPTRRQWLNQAMTAGHADCGGSDASGHSVFVEFKAKGKLSSYANWRNFKQKEFCEEKIRAHCFVCVTDTAERLEIIYKEWLELKAANPSAAMTYLLEMLPSSKKERLQEECLFEE